MLASEPSGQSYAHKLGALNSVEVISPYIGVRWPATLQAEIGLLCPTELHGNLLLNQNVFDDKLQ